MLWFRLCTSDEWINHSWHLCRGLRLLAATVAATGAAVAAMAAAWAATFVAAATAARLTAVAAAATRFAAVAAAIVTAITAAAFLGSLSFAHPLHLTTVCLWHQRCDSQDTRVVRHLGYSCVSCFGA